MSDCGKFCEGENDRQVGSGFVFQVQHLVHQYLCISEWRNNTREKKNEAFSAKTRV
jgi:hypothetical protein